MIGILLQRQQSRAILSAIDDPISDQQQQVNCMIASARTLGFVLAVLVAASGVARAATTAETLAQWGLLGTWALDCSQPASSSNGYLTYRAAGTGKVFHTRDFGSRQDSNEVVEATIGRDGMLGLVIHFPALAQTRKFVLMKGPDGRVRAMSNSTVEGAEQTIRDGRFTFNNQPTPWQVRCSRDQAFMMRPPSLCRSHSSGSSCEGTRWWAAGRRQFG